VVNQGFSNPMDLPEVMKDASTLSRAVRIMAEDHSIDFIVLNLSVHFFDSPPQIVADARKYLSEVSRSGCNGKPVIIAMHDFANIIRGSSAPAN